MKKSLISLVLLISIFTQMLLSQDNIKLESIELHSYLNSPDTVVYWYKDTADNRLIKRSHSLNTVPDSPANDDIRMRIPARWSASLENLEFGFTQFSWQYREKFEEALLNVLNNRTGSSSKPAIKLLERIDAPNAESGEWAFMGDGKNTIVMAADNLFQNSPDSIAFVRWSGMDSNNQTLTEVDVFLNCLFFERFKDTEIRSLATTIILHEFGHIYGYLHTCWDEDLMLDTHRNVPKWKFDNQASKTWQLHKARDKMVYSKTPLLYPQMIPLEHSIVDISQMSEIAGVDPEVMHYYIYELINTNLHGREDDPLEIKFFAGWQERSLSQFKKEPFRNRSPILEVFYYGSADPAYNQGMSILHFDNQDNLNKLIQAIDEKGEPGSIDDTSYLGILKTTLVVSGYLNKNDKVKHTIFSNIYLTYSINLNYRRGDM